MNATIATNKEQTEVVQQVQLLGESYFKISDSHRLRPFFMTIVSDSDHWMFIGSNGGLTAGRKNAEFALFPYYTDDKIIESIETTGCKTIFRIKKGAETLIWEPFSKRDEAKYDFSRNLYKNYYGNKIVFEEINHSLGLKFQYQWASSDKYGFVRTAYLHNLNEAALQIELLDGLQNIIPYGVGSYTQNFYSNLVDAYKRNELLTDAGLGIYALSAIIVDRAEPSEALKANVAWSTGLDVENHLVSSLQVDDFRKGKAIRSEQDVKAEKGAYLLQTSLKLGANDTKRWQIIANVNQSQSDVIALSQTIQKTDKLSQVLAEDIDLGSRKLEALVGAADGLQCTSDDLMNARHFSNTMFNIMRGGIFDEHYQIEKSDFIPYIVKANKHLQGLAALDKLPDFFSLSELKAIAQQSENADFKRLCLEYLPLKFSRRHGDPSRPWNVFSINTRNEADNSKVLDYQGNWRDIFQNWEALALSYPDFIESMICKFLNASTFDGYNPYRVTKGGFDWESIEPDDPWSYIGYWGDHQIIYLLKFLEFSENYRPGKLEAAFQEELFVYANVPYKIKSFEDILKNPKDTILFDEHLDKTIRAEREKQGADAALLSSATESIYKVNFLEKILATVLAKLSNFIPEGGIWMNTQRPEWNDANNALVGNGVSMVTLYYLRRFMSFLEQLLGKVSLETVSVSSELVDFYKKVQHTFEAHQGLLKGSINDKDRMTVLSELGSAASDYRNTIYKEAFSGQKEAVAIQDLLQFTQLTLRYLEHSIDANRRADKLYHAYNLMTIENDNSVSIDYLDEMLEGQVAVLSAKYLNAQETIETLDALKASALFRADQYSYILYPNKELPRFLEKNNVPEEAVLKNGLLSRLIEDEDSSIIERDVLGNYHFNGNFKNADDLKDGLSQLPPRYSKLLANSPQVLELFETVFNHKAFTGRSGTFFGYEGLGSIYWHMVSKLLLAVEECSLQAIENKEDDFIVGRLLDHFYEIQAGIGVHKPPQLYGAFPTDAYSHTPAGKGAQQPGMTGQVKEDVLSRFGELGVFIRSGRLVFNPCLLRKSEFLSEEKKMIFIDKSGQRTSLNIPSNCLGFTYCQVPVVYHIASENSIEILDKDGNTNLIEGLSIDKATSEAIFLRTGQIKQLDVFVQETILK